MTTTTFPRWQVLTRFDILDRDGTLYLRRWRLLQTPWFGIYLHRIEQPDRDRDLHDHPWPFLSIVLRGGYVELRPAVCAGRRSSLLLPTRRGWLSIAFRRATDLHRVYRLLRVPTWTLLFVGPKCRTWGFQTDHGWVRHADYLGEQHPVDVGTGGQDGAT